jgi:hypothetical protein
VTPTEVVVWGSGFITTPPAAEPPPAAAPPPSTCTVPSLRGFGLVAVKKLLHGDDCAIGHVRLARGATKVKGKVVKQFELAGTQPPAARRSRSSSAHTERARRAPLFLMALRRP